MDPVNFKKDQRRSVCGDTACCSDTECFLLRKKTM